MTIKFINIIQKSIEKSLSKAGVATIFDFMKTKIIEQVKTELSGSDKKKNVDKSVVAFITATMRTSNPITKALINILIDYVPVITQCIYDYLSKYVDGLTEV